ncbi:MAG: DUF47 family protein [Clostridiales bacterium]|nr:DUF47 family protein [Clostridiales bacterium]
MKDEKDKKKNKDKKKKEQKKVKNYNYFEALVLFTDYSCKAAELLHSILSNFDSEKLEEQMKLMHEIEHEADLAKHGMMKYLVKEFITPIDREDISSLAQEIDNVTDTIEDVLMQLYMYNIKTIRPEALDFSVTIVACTRALRTAMQDYHNYKKSATVIENIININNMEEDEESGFLCYWNKEVLFVPTVEVSLEWLNRKIHMLMIFKNMELAGKIENKFSRYCMNIEDDGRPIAKLTPEELVDKVKGGINTNALVIPAHCLTPWYGIMGNNNHLLDIREVLPEDPDAVETGLSANKNMVRQLPNMEKVPLVSFSDAHSLHNIGREVTIFKEELSWNGMVKALKENNIDTIEYPPALGKYHATGHRLCNYKKHNYENCWSDIVCQ